MQNPVWVPNAISPLRNAEVDSASFLGLFIGLSQLFFLFSANILGKFKQIYNNKKV